MIPSNLRGFVVRLREVTDRSAVSWVEGAPDAYYCTHNGYDVHLSYREDNETGETAFHFLLKSKGREAFFSVTHDEADYVSMKNLYETVSVQAAGFDDIEDQFFA